MIAAAIFAPKVTNGITRACTFLDFVTEIESMEIDTEFEPDFVPGGIEAWVEANLRRDVADAGRSMGDLVWAEGSARVIWDAERRATARGQVVLFMVVNDDC